MLRYLVILVGMVSLAVATAFFSFQGRLSALPDDPDNRGTFTYADSQDPTNLDPNKTSASVDFRLLKCLYQTLLVYEFGGENLEPGVATAVPEPTNNGLTYTFNLRREARWSDGEPVTAHDFVYGWRRALLPDTGSDYAALLFKIKGGRDFFNWRMGLLDFSSLQDKENFPQDELPAFLERFPELERQAAVDADGNPVLSPEQKWELTEQMFDELVGIKALDDHTLEVTLDTPTAFFLELCAFPTFSPTPEHVLKHYTEFTADGSVRVDAAYWIDTDNVVSNGAYVLSSYRAKSRLVMDQNPHYWAKDQMGNLRIVLEIVEDETLAVLLFKDGQVDWIPSISGPELRAKLVDSGYEHAHTVSRAGIYYYQFNCRDNLPNGEANPLVDRRVRQALSMCIDRQAIVDTVTRNGEPPSLVFVPEGQIPGYRSPVEAGLPYDPARAAELLAEAGYPNGEGIPPIDLLVNATGTSGGANVDMAIVIKKIWEDRLGITSVNVRQPEFLVYLEESKQGNFAARRAGWFGDYRDPTTWLDMLHSTDSNNDAGYQSAEYDGLLAAAAAETDPQKRLDILTQAEALLLQEAPICPIYSYVSLMVYDKNRIDIGANPWDNLRLDLVKVQRD